MDNTLERNKLISHLSNEFKLTETDVELFKKLNIFTSALEENHMDILTYVDTGNDHKTTFGLATIGGNVTGVVSESYYIENLEALIEEKLYPKTSEEKEREELEYKQTSVKEYFVLTFGMFKGTAITDMTSPKQLDYCKWIMKTKYSKEQKSRNKSTERKALEWWLKQNK